MIFALIVEIKIQKSLAEYFPPNSSVVESDFIIVYDDITPACDYERQTHRSGDDFTRELHTRCKLVVVDNGHSTLTFKLTLILILEVVTKWKNISDLYLYCPLLHISLSTLLQIFFIKVN